MTLDSIIRCCMEQNLDFVHRPNNILSFDNPDLIFLSENNELIGCIVSSVTEHRNENHLLRRLFQIRTLYPEEMKLIVLNGENIKAGDILNHYCHFVSNSDDGINLLSHVIKECDNNKSVISISKKIRKERMRRSHSILESRQNIINSTIINEVSVLSWINHTPMFSSNVYETENGIFVNLKSSKDNQVLTVLNCIEYDTKKNHVDFNSDYVNRPRCGFIYGQVSSFRQYELSLKYSLLGVKCFFEKSHETDKYYQVVIEN